MMVLGFREKRRRKGEWKDEVRRKVSRTKQRQSWADVRAGWSEKSVLFFTSISNVL
jgi:hypothetical protein